MISAIFTTTSGSKNYYTRETDEKMIELLNEGKKREEVADEIGHSANSITYRVRIIKAAEQKLLKAGVAVTTVAQVLDTLKY